MNGLTAALVHRPSHGCEVSSWGFDDFAGGTSGHVAVGRGGLASVNGAVGSSIGTCAGGALAGNLLAGCGNRYVVRRGRWHWHMRSRRRGGACTGIAWIKVKYISNDFENIFILP